MDLISLKTEKNKYMFLDKLRLYFLDDHVLTGKILHLKGEQRIFT